MTECSLSLAHFGDLLDSAMGAGYQPQSLASYFRNRTGRPLLLRHDVDVSLGTALCMAELEASKGVTSTYFVRVHAAYNLFDQANHRRLRWLLEHDFDIGLHHEVGLFDLDSVSPADQLSRELVVLSNVLGREVLSVSAHLPKRALYRLSPADLAAHGLLYEAGDAVFNQGLFVSDSNRQLKPGCVCRLLGQSDMVYATFHPIWWVEDDPDVNAITAALLSGA